MIFWYLNALRTLIAVAFYSLHLGHPVQCERVWDMPPDSTPRPGDTYEEWYGSFELMCPNPTHDGRSVIFCYGNNC